MISAEQGIIGCILMDSDCMYEIYNKIRPDMFQFDFLRDCYAECLAMYDRGDKVDLLSLATAVENKERSKQFIAEQLTECMTDITSSIFVKNYAETLLKEYRSRQVKYLVDHLDLNPNAINNSMAEIYSRIEELNNNEKQKSKSLSKIADEIKDKYFNSDVGKNLVYTGLYNLDDKLGGLEGGDVTVIGARPAVGKSALVTQIIGNIAAKGKRVGYFNLEMNENQVYERFMARMTKIELTKIRRSKSFSSDEKYSWDKANEDIKKLDVVISTGGKSIGEIRSECRHQNYDVIVIDYLQLVRADRIYNNRANEVGAISGDVKSLAMELKIPIIVLSQLNRLSEGKDTREPNMAELRESGNIEQDASNIILLWNVSDEDYSLKALKIEKQRQGVKLKEGLIFDGGHMEFTESNDDFKLFLKKAKEKGNDFKDTKDSPFN